MPVRGKDAALARRTQARINAPTPSPGGAGSIVLDQGEDAAPDAALMRAAADELKAAMRQQLDTAVDAGDAGMPASSIPFLPIIGYQQPLLRTLFAADDAEAAYAALRAAQGAR